MVLVGLVFGWVASLVALPKMIPYHPSYSFPYLVGPICVAGFAVGELARRMPGSGLLAIAWLAAPVLFNLPALVSHYSDGSRYDFRSAAKYVAEHRRPEEDVAAVAPAYLIFYEPRLSDVVTMSPSRLLEDLQAVEQRGRPTWIMLIAGRSGREPAVQNWINANCRLVKSFRRTRFDFHDYIYDVYKYDTRPAPIPTKP